MTAPADERAQPTETEMIDWVAEQSTKVSGLLARDTVKRQFGVGSSRAGRIINQAAEQLGWDPPAARTGQLNPVPAPSDAGEKTNSAQADQAGGSTRPSPGKGPGGADDQHEQESPAPGERAGDADQPAHPAGGKPETTQANQAGESGRDGIAAQADQAGGTSSQPTAAQAAESTGAAPRRAFARFATAVAEAGEGWVRKATNRADEASGTPDEQPAPAGTSHVSVWVMRAVLALGLLGTGIVTWTGGVSLATRLGWGPVEVAPGVIGLELNPAMFLPLSVELVLAVAVHRVSTTIGSRRYAAVALATVAFGIAMIVQRYAHAATLPDWLGPVIGVVPVIALAMLVALSSIEPNRAR